MIRATSYLIDTGVLIYALRADLRAFRLMQALARQALVSTSAVCAFEVLRGSKSARQELAVERLLSRLEVLPLDVSVSRSAADIVRALPGIFGSKETVPDALIAGTAVVNKGTFVTLNTRQFKRAPFPGLDVILIDQDAPDWAAAVP